MHPVRRPASTAWGNGMTKTGAGAGAETDTGGATAAAAAAAVLDAKDESSGITFGDFGGHTDDTTAGGGEAGGGGGGGPRGNGGAGAGNSAAGSKAGGRRAGGAGGDGEEKAASLVRTLALSNFGNRPAFLEVRLYDASRPAVGRRRHSLEALPFL